MKSLIEASEHMYQKYFDTLRLYDNSIIDRHCPGPGPAGLLTRHEFVPCRYPLQSLWVMHSEREKKQPKNIHDKVLFTKAPYLMANDLQNDLSEVVSIELPVYLGRIFMVKDICLTSHGHILTDTFKTQMPYVSRYKTGKMYDDDDEERSSISLYTGEMGVHDVQSTGIPSMDMDFGEQQVLLLIIPHANNFGHEFLDLYPQLFMFRELLNRDPNMKILVHSPLSATKMFPVLHAMGLYPEELNYFIWKEEHRQSLYCMKNIITTTSSYANHVNPEFVAAFKDALMQNLSLTDREVVKLRGEGILISDRRDQPGRRDLIEGDQILDALRLRYSGNSSLPGLKKRSVELFFGNETLEDTIRLFRSSRVYISVHGAQMSNMMFLNPGSVLIEIQPYEFRDVDVFLNLAPALGVTPYRYTSMSGGHWTSTSVNVEHFLGQVTSYIDSLV